MCVGGQNTVDGKDNQEKETMDVSDIMMYYISLNIIGLLLLLAGVLLDLDDVMNLGVVTHIEYVQHFNVSNIGKAYHNPALN